MGFLWRGYDGTSLRDIRSFIWHGYDGCANHGSTSRRDIRSFLWRGYDNSSTPRRFDFSGIANDHYGSPYHDHHGSTHDHHGSTNHHWGAIRRYQLWAPTNNSLSDDWAKQLASCHRLRTSFVILCECI